MDARPPREYVAPKYVIKLSQLVLEGKLEVAPGTLVIVNVAHDAWCAALRPGAPIQACDCNPELELQGGNATE